MDYARIAKLHNKVFSTPRDSPEREQAYSALSEADRAAVFDYDMGIRSGRIKAVNIDEQGGNRNMTYKQFKQKSDSDEKGVMQELSQFAMKCPELYQRYREKWQAEKNEQIRLHNKQLSDGKCGNLRKSR